MTRHLAQYSARYTGMCERCGSLAHATSEHPEGACARCLSRPADVTVGDALALTHGFGQAWCGRCLARAQLRHALERAVRIPALVARSLAP